MHRRRPDWYLLYYLLAALDVVTVLASLTLSQAIMQNYVGSVAASQKWAIREQEYAELAELARAVNAPGNDVFDSRDVGAEAARLRLALASFKAQFDTVRNEVERNARNGEAALLETAFDQIQHAMGEMTAEAALIFGYFETGQPGEAGQRMATMDRKYASLNQAFARLFGSVRTIRHAHFEEQLKAARLLKGLEFLIFGLAILMIAGALWYGSKIYRAARAAEAERSEHMEALALARAEAEAANEAKSKFLAVMSHEIRTPLNSMFLALDVLEEPAGEDERRRYIGMARSSGRLLKRLIDDLLDFSRIEAGKIEFERVQFDLPRLVHELVAPYTRLAGAKGVQLAVRIEPEVPAAVEGDPTRFGQVLANLLDNAVKFTPGGSIDVCIAQRPGGDAATIPLRVTVRDTGIGITPEQQARIFEDFVQADESTCRKYGGSGLGLGIAQRLVALMKGELALRTTPGGGATFWFDVDLAAPCREKPAPAPRASSKDGEEFLRGRRILVVDDVPESRTLVAAALGQLGANVDLAADGAGAVSAAAANRYDAILMDIAMPSMDGFEATRRIRSRERGDEEEVPIIALSAQVMENIFEQCLDAGMDDYLAKPVTKNSIAATLQRWIAPQPG